MKTLIIILSIVFAYVSIGCFFARWILHLAKQNIYPLHELNKPDDVFEEALAYGIFWPFVSIAIFWVYFWAHCVFYPLSRLKQKIMTELDLKENKVYE